MTSKNSFLISLKENMKRRIWVLAVFLLYFFFAYPVGAAFVIQEYQNRMGGMELTSDLLTNMRSDFIEMNGVNELMLLAVLLMAFISAVQGFSYLYKRAKVDMYHSLPVPKAGRFCSIYCNGIVIFVVPYLVGILLSLLVWTVMAGSPDVVMLTSILLSFLKNLLYYLCIYHVIIAAVLLTGNVVITFFAAVILLFYESILKLMIQAYQMCFFDTAFIMGEGVEVGFFSPITNYVEWLETSGGMSAVYFLFLTILAGIISYFLYLNRREDACGKTLAFPVTIPFVKLMLNIPFVLLIGILFYQLSGENIGFAVFGLVIGVLLGHGILEVICSLDLRAVFSHRKLFVISAVASIGLFLIGYLDLTGYDAYVPDVSRLESVALSVESYGSEPYYDKQSKQFESGRYGGMEYAFQNMYLTDLTDLQSVLELAKLPHKKIYDEDSIAYYVKYRLKSGKEKVRKILVSAEESSTILDQIYDSQVFKEGGLQLYDDSIFSNLDGIKTTYYDGITSYPLPDGGFEEIRQAYLSDYTALTYEEVKEETPCGQLILDAGNTKLVGENGRRSYHNLEFPVYPSFAKTAAYLQQFEINPIFEIKPEEVSSITVYDVWNTSRDWTDKKVTYEDFLEIREILENSTISNLQNYGRSSLVYELDCEVVLKNKMVIIMGFDSVETLPDFIQKEFKQEE